jgi:molybdopterin molybdotransferase
MVTFELFARPALLKLQNVSRESPRTLRVSQTIAAGAVPQPLQSGTCARIMTGAALPDGADAVVMREETVERDGETVFFTTPAPRQFIRPRAEDIARGEVALPAGIPVRAAEWGLLASLEQETVWVTKRPRVRLVVTGDEVTPLGEALRAGAIRVSNSWTLRALVASCCADVEIVRVGDRAEEFRTALGGGCDAIITSGGISMGDFDIVRDVLPEEADIHFYKVAMKPGKPVMFGTLKQSRVPVFALPGNPVSVMVTFELFARPALLKLQNRTARRRPVVEAVLQSALRSPEDKVEWARAVISQDEVRSNSGCLQNGRIPPWSARVQENQSSGRLSTMTRANALLELPVGIARVEAGEIVRAHLTDCAEIE